MGDSCTPEFVDGEVRTSSARTRSGLCDRLMTPRLRPSASRLGDCPKGQWTRPEPPPKVLRPTRAALDRDMGALVHFDLRRQAWPPRRISPASSRQPHGAASRPATGRSRSTSATSSSSNYTPYEGDGAFLAGADRAHHGHVEDAAAAARRGAREGHPRRLAGSLEHPRARAGLHRQGQRDHRRPADRRAAQARDHAVRRLARGRGEPRVLRLQAGRARRRDLHQVPQDPQRRRLRRLHGRHQGRTLVGHRHRPAGRLRPRPHHRRLSPRGALRRRLPDRRQGSARRRSSTTATRPRT